MQLPLIIRGLQLYTMAGKLVPAHKRIQISDTFAYEFSPEKGKDYVSVYVDGVRTYRQSVGTEGAVLLLPERLVFLEALDLEHLDLAHLVAAAVQPAAARQAKSMVLHCKVSILADNKTINGKNVRAKGTRQNFFSDAKIAVIEENASGRILQFRGGTFFVHTSRPSNEDGHTSIHLVEVTVQPGYNQARLRSCLADLR